MRKCDTLLSEIGKCEDLLSKVGGMRIAFVKELEMEKAFVKDLERRSEFPKDLKGDRLRVGDSATTAGHRVCRQVKLVSGGARLRAQDTHRKHGYSDIGMLRP